MATTKIKSHFDGSQVVLDDPIEVKPNAKLLVTVADTVIDPERTEWLSFSADNLNRAYDDAELDYSNVNFVVNRDV